MLLARKDRSLDHVVRVLTEYRDNIGDDISAAAAEERGEGDEQAATPNEAAEKRQILTALIEYMRSVG